MKAVRESDEELIHPYCGDCKKSFDKMEKVTRRQAAAYARNNVCVACALLTMGRLSVKERYEGLRRLEERAKQMRDDPERARILKAIASLRSQCSHREVKDSVCTECGAAAKR